MKPRVYRSNLPSIHDMECARQMVDAMRAMMGLGPLYASERPSVPYSNVQMMDHFNLGDGNRRNAPFSSSGI
jgi:hypothetical protein